MSEETLYLRPAGPDDLQLTLDWANDAGTRAGSFSQEAIEPATHASWFARALSGERPLFIGLLDAKPVGLLRFDPVAGRIHWAEIGITVAPDVRGHGLSTRLLEAGFEQARALGLVALLARVRADNPASVRAFERAGYRRDGEETVEGIDALRFIWSNHD